MSATSLPTTLTPAGPQNGPSHSTIHNLLHKFANQTFNVTDSTYGAIGNGVADDTLAFQAAMSDAGAAGGGVVVIPKPSSFYLISDTLTLDTTNVELRGDAWVSSYIKTSAAAPAIQVTAQGLVTIQNLRIGETGTSGTIGLAFNYAAATTGWRYRVHNVQIDGFDTGFQCTNSEHMLADLVVASSARGIGFDINANDHTTNNNGFNYYIRCRAQSCGSDGWDIQHQSASHFVNCESLINTVSNAQVRMRGTCDSCWLMGFDIENGVGGTGTGLLISGSRHIISVREFGLTTGISGSSLTYSTILPGVYGSVTTPISLGSGSTGNVVFPAGYAVTDNSANSGLNEFLDGTPKQERLAVWVADNAQNPSLGTLPAGSYVSAVTIQVTEGFNSDGTDTISVGYDASQTAFATATDVSSTGIATVTLGSEVGYNATSRAVEAYYVNGGSEPTTGKALVILEYYRVPVQVA